MPQKPPENIKPFPPSSWEDWQKRISANLISEKGESLTKPLYAKNNEPQNPPIPKNREWRIHQLYAPDTIEEDVKNGAGAIRVNLSKMWELPKPRQCALSIDDNTALLAMPHILPHWSHAPVHLDMDITRPKMDSKRAAEIAKTMSQEKRGTALAANGVLFHEEGASHAEELARAIFSAWQALQACEKAGLSRQNAAQQIRFLLAADAQIFLTIAKLRACRILWANLAGETAQIHAMTSKRMMAAKNPLTNANRVTAAVFAAICGGADDITARPYLTKGAETLQAARLALNTQLILKKEAHAGRVADPAAGSFAAEALTNDLRQAAWKILAKIGGKNFASPLPNLSKNAATQKKNAAPKNPRRNPNQKPLREKRRFSSQSRPFLSRLRPLPARTLSLHVSRKTMDNTTICRILHRRRKQRLLSPKPRRRTDGTLSRL